MCASHPQRYIVNERQTCAIQNVEFSALKLNICVVVSELCLPLFKCGTYDTFGEGVPLFRVVYRVNLTSSNCDELISVHIFTLYIDVIQLFFH